jgi:hypothetical protein
MKSIRLLFVLVVFCASCYQQQDPLVRSAYDLQRMANQFASQEEDKIQQFNTLRLGMSQDDVIKRLGSPTSQQLISTVNDESRELWVYHGALRSLGTLTFVNKRLIEIKKE